MYGYEPVQADIDDGLFWLWPGGDEINQAEILIYCAIVQKRRLDQFKQMWHVFKHNLLIDLGK